MAGTGRTGAIRHDNGDDDGDEVALVDVGDDDAWADEPAPAARRRFGRAQTAERAGKPAKSARPARPARPEKATPLDDGLPASRMRGNEVGYGYAAGAFSTVVAAVLLVFHTGTGAPKHVDLIWAALGVVGGLALAGSVRWRNRMATASVSLLTGFVIGQAKGPTSLAGVKTAGFLIPAIFALLIYVRQSKADRAARNAAKGTASGRTGATSGRGRSVVDAKATAAAPAGGRGRPTGRYTPPKDRTPPTKGKDRRR